MTISYRLFYTDCYWWLIDQWSKLGPNLRKGWVPEPRSWKFGHNRGILAAFRAGAKGRRYTPIQTDLLSPNLTLIIANGSAYNWKSPHISKYGPNRA